MNAWLLYLILKMDSIQSFFIGVCVCTIILTLVAFTASFVYEEYDNTIDEDIAGRINARNIGFKLLPMFVMSCLLVTFIPSTQELATIYIAPKVYTAVTTNKKLNKIPDKLLDSVNNLLDGYLKGAKQ